eukprot:gnl/MRDRNA2_/MRDRNA2_72725_c0_seq1.p1 gnl/MRDRNA2_/MRDRNA2_72725_c0~~gnl/MRDRNA2_/MRDRNA2_72725_c0_seq1.p1  ORF type:complete len:314 (-),score=48.24 gnl/MRDRNA2_/MRDRNA2_72725_c0_seq1:214-1155(-)
MPPRGRWARNVPAVATSTNTSNSIAHPRVDAPFSLNASGSASELVPGFVHFRGILPLLCQQRLLDIACGVASESSSDGASAGWYRREGQSCLLNDGNKARFWDAVERFPAEFRSLGEELAQLAGQQFSTHLGVPSSKFNARVGALNFYTGSGRMNWHADDYNFAKADRPIVMASLGDSADFGYKLRKQDPDQSVRLESGDVIIFGGPARDLVHALLRVYPRTAPSDLQFPSPPGVGRISITWRDVGPEDGLTFNSDERLGLVVTKNTLPRYLPKKGLKATPTSCAQCKAQASKGWHGDDGVYYCFNCWKAWGG